MYRRTQFYITADAPTVPIEHSRLCDGHAKLALSKFYRDRDATCGTCGQDFILEALAQKEILESNGVPVKALDGRGAFCPSCLPRRRRINALKRLRARLLQEMSIFALSAEHNVLASLEARCTLLEHFGEGNAQSGLHILKEASHSFPELKLSTLRTRLLAFVVGKTTPTAPSALELRSLQREEQVLRAAAKDGLERETLYICDLEAPVSCPHCHFTTAHPLCVFDNALVCNQCDGPFDFDKPKLSAAQSLDADGCAPS